jgi:myo-inositol-1(or 4)-monophosphatase
MPTGGHDTVPGNRVIDRTLADAVLALCGRSARGRPRPSDSGRPAAARTSATAACCRPSIAQRGQAARWPGRVAAEAGFLGEELGRSGREDLCWMVDPLDGTTNFLSGLGSFAISVALVRDGVAELGVVHAPVPMRRSSACAAAVPIATAAGWGRCGRCRWRRRWLRSGCRRCHRPPLGPRCSSASAPSGRAARDLRCLGCAALELCHVAAGDLQGFWEIRLKPWDWAAATVLLAETGCGIADAAGKPHRLFGADGICAGHPVAFDALVDIVAGAPSHTDRAERRTEMTQTDGWVLATDLDGTFLGGSPAERQRFYRWLEAPQTGCTLIFVTGRELENTLPLLDRPAPASPRCRARATSSPTSAPRSATATAWRPSPRCRTGWSRPGAMPMPRVEALLADEPGHRAPERRRPLPRVLFL